MTNKNDLIHEAVKAVRQAADCLAVLHAEVEAARTAKDPRHLSPPSAVSLELQALDDILHLSVLAAARLDLLWDAGERIAELKSQIPPEDDVGNYRCSTADSAPQAIPSATKGQGAG